jgi:heme oxygenase
MSAHATLKARTAANHSVIDAMYSRFDLEDRNSYINFLHAHSAALVPIEAVLGHGSDLPPWRPRAALLAQDLKAFGVRPSKPRATWESIGLAEKFGLLYVLEGSRFGSRLLLRQVGLGYSSRYLAATLKLEEWRAFTEALETRARAENADWLEGVVSGANRGFQLFKLSAAEFFIRRRSQAKSNTSHS